MEGEAKFDRLAGGMLVLPAAGIVLMMAHHPMHGGGGNGGMSEFVHGAMIVLIALVTYGLAHMALRRGIGRPAPLAGLIAWSIATFANIGAATINGFAVTALAAHPGMGPDAFALAWELNQALARIAVVAAGAAMLLWSHGWLAKPSWLGRIVGAHGVLLGIMPVVLLATGSVTMNVAGALLVYCAHAIWIAMVGVYLLSGRFANDLALNASDGM